jgi:hypothetical protein
MNRKVLLTITSVVAFAIGSFAIVAPDVLITNVKHAAPSDTANVMLRTVGILLIAIAILDYLVRNHEDSPTMRSILIANLALQLGIMPIDPSAYASGVFKELGSFAPNTVLHVLLAAGFAYNVAKTRVPSGYRRTQAPNVQIP